MTNDESNSKSENPNSKQREEDTWVRVGQRTGDTTARERAGMVKRPPHILVTTPESLALCLASAGMRRHLVGVRRIVIDELHSVGGSKRGVDLMLSVERLSDLVMRNGGADPQRIGLSATIAPLERMAGFLVGEGEGSCPQMAQISADNTGGGRKGSGGLGRECAIADAGFERALELEIESVFGGGGERGGSPFVTTAAINRGVYGFLEKTIRAHRTTLVFTNLRSATERVTFALRKRFAAALDKGEASVEAMIAPDQIQAHHSSVDRDLRLEIERRLKAGELRCVVCSTSLELGIDIGTIDRVVLLNSPKGVARGLQRVGRSGHWLGGVGKGTFVPTVPADLIEAIVTMEAMRKKAIGEMDYPRGCVDVLAQHVIGMAAVQGGADGVGVEDAYQVVRRTASFAGMAREKFLAVVDYVVEGAKLLRDGDVLRVPGKGTAGLYAQNVGTITQEGQVKVRIRDGALLGTIEEGFAQVLKVGDRFVLAGRCVQMEGSKGMSMEVTECGGQTPTVPRWYSGTMAMEAGLAGRMREFRGKVRAIAPAGEEAIARMLMRHFQVGETIARTAAVYLFAQHRYADIPVEGELLVERVPDETGAGGAATVLVFHTMIGRAANEALARAVAYRMHKRFGGKAIGEAGKKGAMAVGGATVVVDDYAFGVWVEATTAARRADRTLIRSLLSPVGFEEDLTAAVEKSDLFRAQFRFTAIRAHALLQNKFGRRRFIGQMQSYATRLYEALQEQEPGHLLIEETRRTVMEDLLCAPAAKKFLEGLVRQGLRLVDLPTPSPFAFGLFATGRRDTLQLADTADVLLAMYEAVRGRLKEEPVGQAELFT